ncbi:MAG: hypothetical protein IPM82_15050 [Saprospiraceae bacterium]|nr:hypothetical protein [Saprospiraceae bacterium]
MRLAFVEKSLMPLAAATFAQRHRRPSAILKMAGAQINPHFDGPGRRTCISSVKARINPVVLILSSLLSKALRLGFWPILPQFQLF